MLLHSFIWTYFWRCLRCRSGFDTLFIAFPLRYCLVLKLWRGAYSRNSSDWRSRASRTALYYKSFTWILTLAPKCSACAASSSLCRWSSSRGMDKNTLSIEWVPFLSTSIQRYLKWIHRASGDPLGQLLSKPNFPLFTLAVRCIFESP